MDQFDALQAFSRQVFTPYSRLLISTAFVAVSRVGCLGVSGVILMHGSPISECQCDVSMSDFCQSVPSEKYCSIT